MDDGADPHPATGAPRPRNGSRATQRRLREPQSRMARDADGAGLHPATGAPQPRSGAHPTQIGFLPGRGRLSDNYPSQHLRWQLQHERVERARGRSLERDSSRGRGVRLRSSAQDVSELPAPAMDLPTFDALSLSDTLNTTTVTIEEPFHKMCDNFEWVLDTRAWKHHTSNLQLLEDLHEVGYGSVHSETLSVPNVRYVIEDRRNVISVAQLAMEHGLVTVFEPRSCFVKDKNTGMIVGKGHVCNGVYVLDYLRIHKVGRGIQGGRDGGGGEQGAVVEEEIVKIAVKEKESTSQTSGVMELTSISGLCIEKDYWFPDMNGTFYFTLNPELLSELMTHDVQEVADMPVKPGLVRDSNSCLMGDTESEENIIGQGQLHKGKYVLENLKIAQDKVGEARFMGREEQGTQDGGLRGIEARITTQGEGGGYKGGGESRERSCNLYSGGGGEGGGWHGGGGADSGGGHGGGGEEGTGKQTTEAEEEGTTCVQASTKAIGPGALASSEPSQTSDQRPKHFYVDSGAGYHVAWNGDILHQYHDSLGIRAPIQTINGVTGGAPMPVVGIRFIDGAGGRLDHVLFVPASVVNLVSVSQLSDQYNVQVSFCKDKVWIDKREDGTRVGRGYLMGKHYVLDHLHAGSLVSMSLPGL